MANDQPHEEISLSYRLRFLLWLEDMTTPSADDSITYLPSRENWRIAEWIELPNKRRTCLSFYPRAALYLLARAVRSLRLSRLGWAVWRWWAVAHYCLTGKCGLACGMATFRQMADGTPVDLFVPEAGCPIHDEVTRLLPVLDFVKGAVALARDACASLYAGFPDEAVEEEFAAALSGDEEQEPWATGRW